MCDWYTFVCNKELQGKIYWAWCLKSKRQKCYASVRQYGDLFTPSHHSHIHKADFGALVKVKAMVEAKQEGKEKLFKSASGIVRIAINNATTATPVLGTAIPDPVNMARAVNRHRQTLRTK